MCFPYGTFSFFQRLFCHLKIHPGQLGCRTSHCLAILFSCNSKFTLFLKIKVDFLDAQTSLAPTHVCLSVGWLVTLLNFHTIRVSGCSTWKVEKSNPQLFLDAQASLAPTHLCPSVGNTFEFPFYQCFWSPYVKSWRERTPIIFRCASISST